MKKYFFTLVAVTAMFASCTKDAEFIETGIMDSKAITTIGATTVNSTRAVVNSEDDTKVNWEDGDRLGVFGTNGSSESRNLAYTLDSGSGTTNGTFKNPSSDITSISAVMYPYQENASWADNSKIVCEIPSVQTATKGSFDKAAAIMYSIGSTNNGVALNYAVNFLKVTVAENNVHSITITSKNTELSGNIGITSGSITAVSGSQKYVTLKAEKGHVFEPGNYYIAVKPGDIVEPAITYVYYQDGHKAKVITKKKENTTLTFADGCNVKPISVNFSYNYGTTTRYAFQLWADGPYFADTNVMSDAGDASIKGLYLSKDAETGWGVNWRKPTKDEFDALLSNCDKSYTIEKSVNGCRFTGKGDYSNNVFFPKAGYIYHGESVTTSDGELGLYWSSTNDGWDYYYLKISKNACTVEKTNNMDSYAMNNQNKFSVRMVLKE